jgi:energy-coupling factor transporter ATP-binding protein EcfA2
MAIFAGSATIPNRIAISDSGWKQLVDAQKYVDERPYKGIRLTEFYVEKLFDEFTYTIPLNIERRVTAIVAPNGAGKTLCLRMISGLFRQKWSVFTTNRFARISYRFNEGSTVTIEQFRSADSAEGQQTKRPTFKLTVTDSDDLELADWTHTTGEPGRLAPSIERYIPFVTRVGPNVWRHDNTSETYDFQELVEAYASLLPESSRERFVGKVPDRLKAIIQEIDCHLIETQRLLILRDDGRTLGQPYYRPAGRPPSTLAIAGKAQALKDIIAKDLGSYATLSQSLDRSFPRRVISAPTRKPFEDLKTRLQELDRRRNELMDAGILDTETDEPVALPEEEHLETAMARVLSIYVDDNDRKLSSLTDLLKKIKLFKTLIDQRFITKDVLINKTNGMEVTYKGRNVPIEGLSSGEQHQLVLFFELLFEIKENALILIDEPELSLHVVWQKKFIGDLMKIIDLNKFDVILATHSPQLIGRWNDLVVELGDIYGEDDEVSDEVAGE